MLSVEHGDAADNTAAKTKDAAANSNPPHNDNDADPAKEEKDEESPAPMQDVVAAVEPGLVAPEDAALAAALVGGEEDTSPGGVDVLATSAGVEVVDDNEDPEAPPPVDDDDDEAPEQPRPMLHPIVQKAKDVHETKIRPALQKAGDSVRQVHQATVQGAQQLHQATVQGAQQVQQKVGQKSRELSIGTQMAMAAASAQTKHALGQIGGNPLEAVTGDNDDDENNQDVAGHRVKGEGSDGWITGFHSYSIQGLSVVGFLSALTSMILVVGHLVDFSSLLTLVLSPLVFWQKTKLKELGGMRGQQNELRHHVNHLTSENTKLTSSIDNMEQQVEKLKYVEHELDGIAKTSGGQVDRLVNIVHENGQIQKEIKEILDDEILQQIITAIINTDRDQDYKLSKREVRQLEYRLKNIPGVIFNHERFQEFVASDEGDLTLADVTNIARNLQDDSIPDEKRIFRYTPKQVLEAKKAAAAEGGGEDATASTPAVTAP